MTVKKDTAVAGLLCFCLLTSSCGRAASRDVAAARLSDDEKHRLYAAALAASESPVDSEIFKRVCRHIGIVDTAGRPNDKYLQFASAHVDWAARAQTEQFRSEINTTEKSRQYIDQYLTGSVVDVSRD